MPSIEPSPPEGPGPSARIALWLLAALGLCLLVFNAYYFFIRRGVGPDYYLKRAFSRPSDTILDDPLYRDYAEEYQRLNAKLSGRKVIVFAGDSITRRFKLEEYFPDHPVVNRGIFSDTTLGLLKRLDHTVNNLSIGQLFIMIGYNDLRYRDNEEILRNVDQILSRCKADRIIVQSLLPVAGTRPETNARILQMNAGLQDLCRKHRCEYLDLHRPFARGEAIDPAYTRDGAHPNAAGYELWAGIICGVLEKRDTD